MKIAITFSDDKPLYQLVYSNGIAQNAKFLYDLLDLIGHEPFFLCFGDKVENSSSLFGKNYRYLTYQGVMNQQLKLPVVLEVAVTLNPEHRVGLKKNSTQKLFLFDTEIHWCWILKKLFYMTKLMGLSMCQNLMLYGHRHII